MRNLKRTYLRRYDIDTNVPCTSSAWDTLNDDLVFTLGPTRDKPIIELWRQSQILLQGSQSALIASWDASCPLPDLEADEVLSLQHLVSSDKICLVLRGGDIVVIRPNSTPEEERIEIVGSVDVGITSAAWSPDEDLLAISTRGNTLLFMTTEFDNVATATFSADDTRLSKQVSVGWGKSETQFKGKGAKALRDPTVPERVDEGTRSTCDDGEVTISWRGDGAYLAVSTIEPQSRRMIRVFSREGVLDSVSEAVDGLDGSVAWKPSGQLIAAVKRCEAGAQVVFFERNGLRHGEFSLRLTESDSTTWARRISLFWNVDSTVLAVVFTDRIQLWTMGNYHYYLKTEFILGENLGPASFSMAKWHPEEPLSCLLSLIPWIVSTTAQRYGSEDDECPCPSALYTMRLEHSVCEHPNNTPHDLGNIAVVDGGIYAETLLVLRWREG